MAEMKGIKLCGDCVNYDWKKHKCKIGCNDDSNAQASFYGDCPLPDVVPRERYDNVMENLKAVLAERAENEVAKEIFAEICSVEHEGGFVVLTARELAELKKKYTGGE